MSERGDFFAEASKSATPSKPLPKRGDFFSGAVKDEDLDTADTALQKAAVRGKGYMDAEAIRRGGYNPFTDSAVAEVPAGINKGVADLLGMPVDALLNAGNLASAGMGYLHSKITGKAAPEWLYGPQNADNIPLTGAWNEQALNTAIGEDVTSVRNPGDLTARLVHAGASGIPASIAGGPSAPSIASGVAGSAAAAGASELGLDPATQSVAAALAGHGVTRIPKAAPAPTKPTAQEILDKKASGQSMGAAGASVDLQKLSPALRTEVEKAVVKTGGAVNEQALARQIQADSLPVKVPMSEGQVLGDGRLISEERNARGKTPGAVEAFEGQNKALTENLRVFRDTAGEDVFSTNPVEHGDTLIGRYKAIDDARNQVIGEKYQAVRDAAGGEFPIDTQVLQSNVRAALKKQMSTNSAPPDVMAALDEAAATGKMSFEDFETLRTNLSRIQREASDGQVRHAAGVIREQIEQLPMNEGASGLKGLADEARNAARERFQALDADPAYKAAVDGSTPPDKFVQKFVINGTRDNVARLSEAMGPDATSAQTLKVATIDHLRQAAGIDGSYNGKFSQAGYNKALRALEPKLGSLVDTALAEHMTNLGDVARYSQFQPEGSFVNNSNTFVASAAEKAAALAENAGNYAMPGLGVGTLVRERVAKRAAEKKVKKSWGPGAGLTRLSDLTKLKEPK